MSQIDDLEKVKKVLTRIERFLRVTLPDLAAGLPGIAEISKKYLALDDVINARIGRTIRETRDETLRFLEETNIVLRFLECPTASLPDEKIAGMMKCTAHLMDVCDRLAITVGLVGLHLTDLAMPNIDANRAGLLTTIFRSAIWDLTFDPRRINEQKLSDVITYMQAEGPAYLIIDIADQCKSELRLVQALSAECLIREADALASPHTDPNAYIDFRDTMTATCGQIVENGTLVSLN